MIRIDRGDGGLQAIVCYYLGGLRRGFTGGSYLGLGRPRWGSTALWMGTFVGLMVLSMFILPATEEDTPGFMLESVRSATVPFLLIVGVVVGAPLLEEFVFRGLLFRGWRSSKLGLHGTVAVTSLLWTVLHAGQYGIGILGWLFALGLIFGYARHHTGSVWVPIAMHALNNALATIETYRILD